MKFAYLAVLLMLTGCVSQPPTFSPLPSPKASTVSVQAPKVAAVSAPKVLTPTVVTVPPAPPVMQPVFEAVSAPAQPAQPQTPQLASIGSVSLQPSQRFEIAQDHCMVVQWMVRPLSYSIDVSTNLTTSWRSLGINVTTNFVPASGQVLVATNLFPSGQAVMFTNGNPAVVFVDYDIAYPMKFYRIREVQP